MSSNKVDDWRQQKRRRKKVMESEELANTEAKTEAADR